MSEHKLFLATAHFKIFLIALSLAIPLAVLYFLYPLSFDKTFNGRAYYMFFIWLVVLEFALDWDKYKSETSKMDVKRVVAFGLALVLPTVYVVASNFFGLNAAIRELTRLSGIISPSLADYVDRLNFTPLATEFLVFAVLFAVIILCAYRLKGLKDFLLPIALLGVVGSMSMINLLSPSFLPFQIIVPTTARLSADVLNLMGYITYLMPSRDFMPALFVSDPASMLSWQARIAWPCAGVESLMLYTIIMLLFLKKSDIPRLHKVIYFAVGAAVTYFINILRIVTLFIIGLNGGEVWVFHDYYGQFYSAIWIMTYPLIIIGSQVLWSKYKGTIMNFITKD
ncbi:MAG TPA: exosortase/archaeosortase family protein [Candidatus Bathyarchaeia archaeon]